MGGSLKDKYFWKLQGFVALNVVIYIAVILGINLEFYTNLNFSEDSLKQLSPPFISIFITLILSGILPSEIKSKIVFFKWKNPLPGSRIFTELAQKDSRINLNDIQSKYGDLPTDSAEQNQLWYKIYKQYRSEITIQKSHHDFLFTRDLTSVSFIFLVLFPISIFFISNSLIISITYILYLVVQFILLRQVAKNYGNRFACNVLAEAT
ncbi:MAG: hypothetical protein WDZ80_01585 [Candidatus Paceibacterota bacterium]